MKYLIAITCIVLTVCNCSNKIIPSEYQSESLKILKQSDHSYVHVSYLESKSFGKVPCNGMIVVDEGEAVVIDTPVDESSSKELIKFVQRKLKYKIKAVVVSHFHVDCLGGLLEFHRQGIASYGTHKTIKLATANNWTSPQNAFDDALELKVGALKVLSKFLGEGHTVDNIVSFVPDENILFGGCLLKSIGSGKGNLNDANIEAWSQTVEKVKQAFPEAQTIIPGHGKWGGRELLDYTIAMFQD